MSIEEKASKSYSKNLTPTCDGFILKLVRTEEYGEAERVFANYLRSVFMDGYENGHSEGYNDGIEDQHDPLDEDHDDEESNLEWCSECQQDAIAQLQAKVVALEMRVLALENEH